MDDTPEPHTGAEEYLEAEIELVASAPAVEKQAREILEALPGVFAVSFSKSMLTAHYDPTRGLEEHMLRDLRAAGIEVRHAEAHRDSPLS